MISYSVSYFYIEKTFFLSFSNHFHFVNDFIMQI